MKNIRTYKPEKYTGPDYEEVEPNIYKTHYAMSESENSLSLKGISDEDKAEMLRNMNGWKQGEGNCEEDLYVLIYEGKKYYREMDENESDFDVIYENMNQELQEVYVTSIVFEPEPDYGENAPSETQISQYPLEAILDEFYCEVFDFYEKENESDANNSYVEFASDDIEYIRKLLSIIGKHVYNKEDGEYIKLVIE